MFKIQSMSPSGHGILEENGNIYSILGAFPGDEIEAEAIKAWEILTMQKLFPF